MKTEFVIQKLNVDLGYIWEDFLVCTDEDLVWKYFDEFLPQVAKGHMVFLQRTVDDKVIRNS